MTRYVLGVYCLCAGHTLAAASGDNGPARHLPSALAPSLRYDADHEAADVPRSRAATLLLDPAAIDGVESVVLRCDWLSSIGLEVYANRREKRCDDRAALLDQVTNQPRAADVFGGARAAGSSSNTVLISTPWSPPTMPGGSGVTCYVDHIAIGDKVILLQAALCIRDYLYKMEQPAAK